MFGGLCLEGFCWYLLFIGGWIVVVDFFFEYDVLVCYVVDVWWGREVGFESN